MEPHKFDKQIQETLENRRLQPSNDAWKKLSNRLDENTKKQNKAYWYTGVAASIVGLLFIAVQFYNTNAKEPVIVDTPTVKQVENSQIVVEEPKTTNAVLETKQAVNTINNFKENSIAKTTETNEVLEEKHSVQKEINQKILTFEEQKIKDLVAKVEDLKAQNKEVTNEDINALLLEAQKEIRFKKRRVYSTRFSGWTRRWCFDFCFRRSKAK